MIQKVVFTGGLDSDTTDELLPTNRRRYSLNCRVLSSENSTVGAVETCNGNTLVTFALPAGVNQCIGSKEDELCRMVYFFVHNDLENHSILEYNAITNTIAKVFQDSMVGQVFNTLRFQLTHLITGINIIELDADNHLLYWTDNYISTIDPNIYNEPRKINIEKGKYFMSGNHVLGYKTPFDPEIIFRIKKPADCGLEYEWSGLYTQYNFLANSTIPLILVPADVGNEFSISFNNEIYDPNNEFIDPFWTVPTTDNYNLNTSFIAQVIGGIGATANAIVDFTVNGVGVLPSISFVITTTAKKITLNIPSYPLVATDFVYVRIVMTSIFGAFVDARISSASFTSNVTALASRINYLLKKSFVFKTQFVHDDSDVSSWSAWSSYNFPSVIRDEVTGNDILAQDNAAIIQVPTGNSIVTKIRIAAKELSQIDFSLVAELDKAQLQIGDNIIYPYTFLNDSGNLTILTRESNKLFDLVPLASQAQELIIGTRINDGLITEGQDPVPFDAIMNLTYIDIGTFPDWASKLTVASFLKSGGAYKYGIVYYDHANRSGLSNIQRGQFTELLPNGTYGTTLYVPFLTESTYNAPHLMPNADMSFVPQVNMEIYNRPPSWATHFQIVRSRNMAIDKYFQFAAQDVVYTDDDGNAVAPNVAVQVGVFINNITDRYLVENPSSTLVYGFTKGDRIRFIADVIGAGPSYNSISAFFPYNDTEIVKFDSATGLVYLKMGPNVPQTMSNGTLFEIYTPSTPAILDNEFMFEIGECYPLTTDTHGNLVHTFSGTNQLIVASSSNVLGGVFITAQLAAGHGLILGDNVKIVGNVWSIYGLIVASNPTNVIIDTTGFTMHLEPLGAHNNGASTIFKSATGTLKSGDCFRIYQNMPWENPPAGLVYRLYSYVENMNISNLWVSNAWDYARPNRVDDNAKRITRPSTIIYSEKFIPETFINGLSTVYDDSFESYEQSFGGIYKLFSDKQSLHMFQELRTGQVLVAQVIYNDLQGNTTVGASEKVLSPQAMYYDGIFGIGKHPESFAVFANAEYFIDVRRGALVRLSNNGLTPISQIGFMHNYFTDKCAEVLALNQKVNILGVWDKKFGEYVVAFEGIPDLFAAETIAWNEKYNAFSTFYSLHPEGLCTNGTGIISFKNGALWTQNTNPLQANFFDIQYQPELWVVLNEQPSIVKVLEGVGLESSEAWEVYQITTPSGQESNIIVSDFRNMEDNQYAEVWRDINTPNVANALFQGDAMRGRTALFKLRFPLASYNKLFCVNLKFIISQPYMR